MKEDRRESTSTWKSWLGFVGGCFLGAVLLVGAWYKALDPVAFAEQIRLEGLDFLLPASTVVLIALLLETGIGTALMLGIRRLSVLIPAAGLVVFFLFLTGRNYYRFTQGTLEETAGCGCFGNLVDRTPAEAFIQDILLLVPALLLSFVAWRTSALSRQRLTLVAVATLGMVSLAWAAPDLPLDNVATRLKPGVAVDEICTGQDEERLCLATLLPELESGEHLVVIGDLEDAVFGEAVTHLDTLAAAESLFVLTASPPEAHHTFFWSWGPTFEIREAPAGLLRPLYRTLPRSFRVSAGRVTETYSGLPPVPGPETT